MERGGRIELDGERLIKRVGWGKWMYRVGYRERWIKRVGWRDRDIWMEKDGLTELDEKRWMKRVRWREM
jgi:hypothetical protein